MTMIMALCHEALQYPVVAADRRWSRWSTTASRLKPIGDFGGKLVRLGSGWMASAGENGFHHVDLGLAAESKVDCCDRDSMSRHIVALASGAPAARTTFISGSASRREVHIFSTHGEAATVRDAPLWFVQSPLAAAPSEFFGALQLARSAHEVMRYVLAEFARVAALPDAADVVGPEVELAYGDRYLRGNAAALSRAGSDHLRAKLTVPPAEVFPTGVLRRLDWRFKEMAARTGSELAASLGDLA